MTIALKETIRQLAVAEGFQQARFTRPDVSEYSEQHWQQISKGFYSGMSWLERNTELRYHPDQLHPETRSILVVRMDYLSPDAMQVVAPDRGEVAQYALGRDYHKLMRKRLTKLGRGISELLEELGFRAFVDSAPVLERQLAEQSGIGWIGKNTLVLNQQAGSWFFLGELFLSVDLPPDPVQGQRHCGSCTACLDTCPTHAFPEPGVLDARKCISYLTIEHHGIIPEELRPLIGNRIFGCDDCQWQCPFTRFRQSSRESDFLPRKSIHNRSLIEMWRWTESDFLENTAGTPIRRLKYNYWQRNLCVAIGNSGTSSWVAELQQDREIIKDPLVLEHLDWAINRLNTAK